MKDRLVKLVTWAVIWTAVTAIAAAILVAGNN